MAAAAAAAGSGKGAAERAAAAAFDAQLDVAVALGWAWTERFCLENFIAVSLCDAMLLSACATTIIWHAPGPMADNCMLIMARQSSVAYASLAPFAAGRTDTLISCPSSLLLPDL
jgi:hypothetical protein